MFYNDPININTDLWLKILNDNSVTREEDLIVLKIIFESPNYEMRASKIAELLKKSHYGEINLQIGRFSKRIIKKTKIKPPTEKKGNIRYWHIPFLGYEKDGKFPWILRPELAEALELIFPSKNNLFYYPNEINDFEYNVLVSEGEKKEFIIHRYERNKKARYICLKHHGYKCIICGFDFVKTYGPIGKNKIHVHHKKPLSEIKENYEVDPINDLCPVCPNCHLIIHSKKDPFTIKEMKEILKITHNFL